MAEDVDLSPERVAKDNKDWNENHNNAGHSFHCEARTSADGAYTYNYIECACGQSFIVLCVER